VVHKLLAKWGLGIVNVQMNGVNGGSFGVTAGHDDAPYTSNTALIEWMLQQEQNLGLSSPKPFRQFEERVFQHRLDLRRLIEALAAARKKIPGCGASTQGTVLLQFCCVSQTMETGIVEWLA